MKATKEQFMAYVEVQMSGVFNMFDRRAIEATGLDRATYMDIISHYSEYRAKYMA